VNARQRRTLRRIFDQPTPADIPWADIVGLFLALEATVTQGRGSRVRVELNGVRAVFHEPHPQRHTLRDAVRSVRDFLESAGIEP
jgi:hypothetical protein